MEFVVYENRLTDVTKMLTKMEKMAHKYNVPFAYEVKETIPMTVRVMAVDPFNVAYEVNRYVVPGVVIEVDYNGFIKANGWTVLAKIEHGDEGNIVTEFGHVHNDLWYTMAANCDHCHTNRPRKTTYIVQHENGEIRQVGHSCLKEYTGINPLTTLYWAEINDIVNDRYNEVSEKVWASSGLSPMCETAGVLALAYDSIKANGYVRAEQYNATKDVVLDGLKRKATVTVEGIAKAQEMVEWLKGLTPDTLDVGSLELDCVPLAKSGYCKRKHIGRLAYIPVAYQRYMDKQAERLAREQENKVQALTSTYVGAIGERMTIDVAKGGFVTSWEGDYGYTYLYKFEDVSGNVFVWFASSPADIKEGVTIKATVKNHNERDGVKQTVVNRCKVVA